MLLNIKQLCAGQTYDEEALGFDHLLDLSAVRLWGEHPFSEPVLISGTVTNRSGILTMGYVADFEMQGVCSRCLVPVSHSCKRDFTHTVLIDFEDGEDIDGFIPAPNGELDLDELVTSDLLLELNGIMLCREDCRGLCPKCGKNLNDGGCCCILNEPDPRFQTLRDYLNETE